MKKTLYGFAIGFLVFATLGAVSLTVKRLPNLEVEGTTSANALVATNTLDVLGPGNSTFGGDVLPGSLTNNLGSPGFPWQHIYASTNSIYLGSHQLGSSNGLPIWDYLAWPGSAPVGTVVNTTSGSAGMPLVLSGTNPTNVVPDWGSWVPSLDTNTDGHPIHILVSSNALSVGSTAITVTSLTNLQSYFTLPTDIMTSTMIGTSSNNITSLSKSSGSIHGIGYFPFDNATITNSFGLFGLGVFPGSGSSISNFQRVFNIGREPGINAIFYDGSDVYNLGENAGDSMVATNGCTDIFNYGFGAGKQSVSDAAFDIFNYGAYAGLQMSATNSFDIFNNGAEAGYGMSLTNTSEIFSYGYYAGSSMIVSGGGDIYNFGNHANEGKTFINKSHMFALGSNSSTTNSNDFTFGDSAYNYMFPGASTTFANVPNVNGNPVLTNSAAFLSKTGDTATGPMVIQQGTGTGLTITNSADKVGLVVNGFAGQTNALMTLTSGGTNALLAYFEGLDKIAFRDANRPVTLRVYNTWTDSANGEWGSINWGDTANSFTIGTKMNGTGLSRSLQFMVGGTNIWYIDATTGALLCNNNLGANIGGASHLVNAISAGGLITGDGLSARYVHFGNFGYLFPGADGVFLMENNATTDFNRIQFGGITTAFAALARQGTGLASVNATNNAPSFLLSSRSILAKTTNYTLVSATSTTGVDTDISKVISNFGASAQITNTLPSAATGYTYTFMVENTNGTMIVAAANNTIRIAGTESAAAGYIVSTNIGNTINLCVGAAGTNWVALSHEGTWTFGP